MLLCFCVFRYNVNQVITMLEEDDSFVDASVYLNLPGDGMDSDEDSDTEEGCSANRLNSRQLSAPAEFVINYGSDNINSLEDIDDNDTDDCEQEEQHEGLERMVMENGSLGSCSPPNVEWKWKKQGLPVKGFPDKPTKRTFTEPLTSMALFNAFFDDECLEYVVKMTNLYAQREKGKHSFHTDVCEMRLFLAMLLLTGYVILPRRRLYWENSDDVLNKALCPMQCHVTDLKSSCRCCMCVIMHLWILLMQWLR